MHACMVVSLPLQMGLLGVEVVCTAVVSQDGSILNQQIVWSVVCEILRLFDGNVRMV